ncbi:hypothetical protein RSal33209_0388 [Renibacterium salmoninarum ATCC 33209]|uniref:Nucleotide pyrophosphatase n=1 Tax=Renibacterium salmoninarum (strain ATCC 33209 / DSM 20767 / JCM 11484 / NBRC 15589 / NCIMB 2235) TaxID=288705 RepID=A9WLW2_RENSM|nr:alkaline phosphatase family protein [Renibacterium salmoninarum]ABY22143.1 hypothetical protein RSal33209_0388 [Renibacterium salmoninarum ATCC 33209]
MKLNPQDHNASDEVNDKELAYGSAAYLKNQNPDASFVYFAQVDGAGHEHGADSAQYSQSILNVDAYVGQLLDAVAARPTRAQENWTIMITTDHGHKPSGGHSGNSVPERSTFVIAQGPGIKAGSTANNLKFVDPAVTALTIAGVKVDPAWGLDGIPLGSVIPDDFDALRSALKPSVDEEITGLGFMHTPPAGWSIDNSKIPKGGTTEWQGWAFTTQEFWSAAERGQGRENFMRGRDVIAVADSDEWDNKTHDSGPFDSTLITPQYNVVGTNEATISFQSYYQQDGSQKGEVLISFDGAAPVTLATLNKNSNGKLSFTAKVPANATTAQIRFRYTGSNNWYWGLDQVAFSAK